jgi:hypothetical protein
MNDKMAGSLRLPLQATPIDRTSSPAALNGSGVEASQDWGQIATTAATTLIPLLASLF